MTETSIDQLDIQFWYRRVYALCRSRLMTPCDSDDATQETFVRAIAKYSDLRSGAAVGGWLRQIAHNVCVDLIRRKQVRRTEPVDIQGIPIDGGSEIASDRDQQEHIMKSINALPETQREIVLLHYYDEMTYDEIAAWVGVARSTVNERLSKARQNLRKVLATTEDVS